MKESNDMAEVLAGQIAVVTGAGRGIGAAVSKRLAGMGATVLLSARDRESLAAAQSEITSAGGRAEIARLDLRDQTSVMALALSIKERFGRCDIVVNNAGIGSMGKPLHETDPAAWEDIMATNLRGPYLMMRALAPLMIAAGTVPHGGEPRRSLLMVRS